MAHLIKWATNTEGSEAGDGLEVADGKRAALQHVKGIEAQAYEEP